ncbi:phosphatase PAP2 family protein [Kitasatospora sp. NPDC096147]|uniref:phosphatase PAP2 family protein n=1 Tax=Kitasatospora sp. NPDC096147 TaxID=3364093 RepID=UPI00381932EF
MPASDRPTVSPPPLMSRGHLALTVLVALLYLLVVLAVVFDTSLVRLDWWLKQLRPYKRWPGVLDFLDLWVVAGQRGPSAVAACAWLGWRCVRRRTVRPLLVMAGALLLLNITVGSVKILTGRLGPHYAHYLDSPELFLGGTIFPSGHTANSVVTWGVLAYLAVRWQRTGVVLAAVVAASVGLTTVYLGTHWLSDVLAGWAAGALVLLALPALEPLVTAVDRRITDLWRAAPARPAAGPAPVSPASSAPPDRPAPEG